eukprot:7376583-Prymnesium_polylepis.2
MSSGASRSSCRRATSTPRHRRAAGSAPIHRRSEEASIWTVTACPTSRLRTSRCKTWPSIRTSSSPPSGRGARRTWSSSSSASTLRSRRARSTSGCGCRATGAGRPRSARSG